MTASIASAPAGRVGEMFRPGDDTAIGAVLAREHPIYASDPLTTLAALADMVTRHLPGSR
jgi:hypothetical protein